MVILIDAKDRKSANDMNIVSERKDYKRLNFSNIIFDNEPMSTEDSLKDITPIHWSDDVLYGVKEAIIKR